MVLVCVPAQEDGDEGDGRGAEPGCRDHPHGRVGVHEVVVVKRLDNCIVPDQ